MRKPIGITYPHRLDPTPEEDEAFNEIERRSKVKQEIISNPSKETKLVLEVALLTDLVRDLAERVRQLEGKQ
jgi:Uma2 family endonuclease